MISSSSLSSPVAKLLVVRKYNCQQQVIHEYFYPAPEGYADAEQKFLEILDWKNQHCPHRHADIHVVDVLMFNTLFYTSDQCYYNSLPKLQQQEESKESLDSTRQIPR